MVVLTDGELSENGNKNLVKTIKKGKSVKIKPEYAHRAKSRKKFDIGSTYVEVSLGEQHMWFYKNGKL